MALAASSSWPITLSKVAGRTSYDAPEILELDYRPMLAALLLAKIHGKEAAYLADQFHQWVAAVITQVATQLAPTGPFAFTGGCAQNKLLGQYLAAQLPRPVLVQEELPPNDASIAFGQMVAVACLNSPARLS